MSVPENAATAVCVQTSSHDLDHYRAQPGNWDVQADQLSRGKFFSQIRSLQFQDLIVYDNRWGAASLIRGESPAGWVMFGGIIQPRRSQMSWCGQVATDQVYACTPGRRAIEFSLESGAHDIVILVKPDLLTQVAGDTALERVLRAGLIDFRHRGPQLIQIVMGHLLRLEKSPGLISYQVIAADIRAEILAFLELCFKPLSTAEEWTLPKNRRQDAIHLALLQVWQSAGTIPGTVHLIQLV